MGKLGAWWKENCMGGGRELEWGKQRRVWELGWAWNRFLWEECTYFEGRVKRRCVMEVFWCALVATGARVLLLWGVTYFTWFVQVGERIGVVPHLGGFPYCRCCLDSNPHVSEAANRTSWDILFFLPSIALLLFSTHFPLHMWRIKHFTTRSQKSLVFCVSLGSVLWRHTPFYRLANTTVPRNTPRASKTINEAV